MKTFIAFVVLAAVAIAEASYSPYGGVISTYGTNWPVASAVAYPSYGVYGKAVLPAAVTKYAYPSHYNAYPVVNKVLDYTVASPIVAPKLWNYGTYGNYALGHSKYVPSIPVEKYLW